MMMIQAQLRDKSSSAAVSRLRKSGILPMALIERTRGTKLIQAPVSQVRDVLAGKDGLKIFPITLDEGKTTSRVVVKQVQRHNVTRKVTALTLQEVGDDDRIRIDIPVSYTGTPKAVAKGLASLITPVSSVVVQGLVKNLPETIEVNVSRMAQNDRILLSDLELPEGLTLVSSPETVMATTVQLRGMADFVEEPESTEAEAAPAAEEA